MRITYQSMITVLCSAFTIAYCHSLQLEQRLLHRDSVKVTPVYREVCGLCKSVRSLRSVTFADRSWSSFAHLDQTECCDCEFMIMFLCKTLQCSLPDRQQC